MVHCFYFLTINVLKFSCLSFSWDYENTDLIQLCICWRWRCPRWRTCNVKLFLQVCKLLKHISGTESLIIWSEHMESIIKAQTPEVGAGNFQFKNKEKWIIALEYALYKMLDKTQKFCRINQRWKKCIFNCFATVAGPERNYNHLKVPFPISMINPFTTSVSL